MISSKSFSQSTARDKDSIQISVKDASVIKNDLITLKSIKQENTNLKDSLKIKNVIIDNQSKDIKSLKKNKKVIKNISLVEGLILLLLSTIQSK